MRCESARAGVFRVSYYIVYTHLDPSNIIVAQVTIDRGRIDEPTSCPNCKNKFCLEMVHNRCLFSDKQMVRLQETPDEIPEGETPQAVTLFGFEDLVRVFFCFFRFMVALAFFLFTTRRCMPLRLIVRSS